MTSPVVTVRPETSIWKAIRTLREAGVKRLPVVTGDDQLVGIVSRVDLLSAFIRTDEQIAEQVRSFVAKILATDLRDVDIEVRDGKVVLGGSLDLAAQRDVLLDLIHHLPGVLDVEDRLEIATDGGRTVPFAPIQPPGDDAGPRVDV